MLNSLILNQSAFFHEFVDGLFDLVIECRSDGSEEVKIISFIK
jgi:hypothetical protein